MPPSFRESKNPVAGFSDLADGFKGPLRIPKLKNHQENQEDEEKEESELEDKGESESEEEEDSEVSFLKELDSKHGLSRSERGTKNELKRNK